MPSQPLDIVRAELDASPRDHEYIDLGNVSTWSAADRQSASDELMRAGEDGDARVPAALNGLLPPAQLVHPLSQTTATSVDDTQQRA